MNIIKSIIKFIIKFINHLSITPTIKNKNTWDNKSDNYILAEYKDALTWINLSKSDSSLDNKTIQEISNAYKTRMIDHILPQMRKRELLEYSEPFDRKLITELTTLTKLSDLQTNNLNN